MAEAPAYTTVPGKLGPLLAKIRETGVPPKVVGSWVKTIGFTSSNDPSMIPVLKQIGFVDAASAPTPAWKEYRGSDYKAVLGRAIKEGYKSLYDVYPDAHLKNPQEIANVFTTKTDAGQQVVSKMVATFKALTALAEFGTAAAATQPATPAAPIIPQTPAASNDTTATIVTQSAKGSSGVTVNINVELTLPETTDEKVFEAFFKAMRKHLLTDASE